MKVQAPIFESLTLGGMFHRHRHNLERTSVGGAGGGPDFICIGQAKAGTGWLLDQLKARSDVWMPPVKEINFLSGTNRKPANRKLVAGGFASRAPVDATGEQHRSTARKSNAPRQDRVYDFNWYRRLFEPKGDAKSGDISPSYFTLPSDRIALAAESLPECRFVLLLREPVSRLWSALCMDVRNGHLNPNDITEWQSLNDIVIRRRLLFSRRTPAKIHLASQCWQKWRSAIGPDRIRFWFFEDIATRPEWVRDEICRFIGVAAGPGTIPASYNRKQGRARIEMPKAVRMRLIEHFEKEYEDCARIFGGYAIDWKDRAKRS